MCLCVLLRAHLINIGVLNVILIVFVLHLDLKSVHVNMDLCWVDSSNCQIS